LQRLSLHPLIYLILSKNYSITREICGDTRLGQQLGCGLSGGRLKNARRILELAFLLQKRSDRNPPRNDET